MINSSFSHAVPLRRAADMARPHSPLRWVWVMLALCVMGGVRLAAASDAPAWMRSQVDAPVPAHDEMTDAVLLYSEYVFSVQPNGNMKRLVRRVYRILRQNGARRGVVRIEHSDQTRILSLHAWCIPATGKTYEAKDKDAVDVSIDVENGELISDLKSKLLQIPAATPGNIVGYEFEQEHLSYDLSDEWMFQDTVPVRETHYTLQLPPGWTFKSTWINHSEAAAVAAGPGQWQWALSDLAAVKVEPEMPPWDAVAGRMVVSLIPPHSQKAGLQSWQDIGLWYGELTRDRRDIPPAVHQQVVGLTANVPTLSGKVQALASFVQSDIRYVAIELGIGGYQPHPAADVFAHRYGDCKDKVTLLGAMLKDIGIDSYYVIINTQRGAITTATPANLDFNHVILAIALPPEVDDPALQAVAQDPTLGRILFFDPTDPFIPLGALPGELQANVGLLVTPDGGRLTALPRLPPEANALRRTATLTLDADGTLRGDVEEVRVGGPAAEQRLSLHATTQEADQIKPVEAMLSDSLGSFRILKAAVGNRQTISMPFLWRYTLEADHYARSAGDLLLVRPRILGNKSSALLETKEPREQPIELYGPQHDTDQFDVALPAGYSVETLPAPVAVDYGFASYRSKTELIDHTLRYTRSFEIKDPDIPVTKAGQLKELYRIISGDERMTAVLKRNSP